MSDANVPAATDEGGEGGDSLDGLRDAAKRGKVALGENEELRREVAFYKAGIPAPDTLEEGDQRGPMISMFMRAYNGELDPEAIRSEAKAMNILDLVSESDERTPSAAELQGQALSADFRAGDPVAPPSEEPMESAKVTLMANFHDNLNEGMERGMAQVEYAAGMIAAAAVDPSVLWDPAKHRLEAEAYEATQRGSNG